ncbi:hypothetical protein ACFSUR_03700 [Halalkalibacter alkalisediminis]|uniref:hypothetical protein n=1 Tax=Halalkalibacter alkalisediminis TaxID=935616 RepID=UPI003627FE63
MKADIDQRIKSIYERGFERLYENIDYSKFRDDIDIQKAIKILNWTMLGFAEEAREKFNSFEEVGTEHLKEWESYSDILKRSFYK